MDERVTCSDGWASVDGDTFCCCIVAGPLIVSCPLAVGSKCWRLWADDVVSSPFSASLICCPEDSVDVDEDVDKVASPSTVELSPLGTKFILITAALGPSFLLASSCSSVFFRGFSAARIPLSTSCCSTVDPPFFSRCFPPFHPVSHRRKKETTTRQEKKQAIISRAVWIHLPNFLLSFFACAIILLPMFGLVSSEANQHVKKAPELLASTTRRDTPTSHLAVIDSGVVRTLPPCRPDVQNSHSHADNQVALATINSQRSSISQHPAKRTN